MNFYNSNLPEINTNYNEHMQIIREITSDEINNVCFECGTLNPEYISINNGIFLCSNCAQNHYQFPKEISNIIKNDFNLLTLNEIKNLFFGGNKNLIEFINFEYPELKQFPPYILYKTKALEFYRNRLKYFIEGGIQPLKPNLDEGYQLINNNFYEKNKNKSDLSSIIENNQIENENLKNIPIINNNIINNKLKNNNSIETEIIDFNYMTAYPTKKVSGNNYCFNNYTYNPGLKITNNTPYKKHIAKFSKKDKTNNINSNVNNVKNINIINNKNINKTKDIKNNYISKKDNNMKIKEININTKSTNHVRKSKSNKCIETDNNVNINQEIDEQNIKEVKEEKIKDKDKDLDKNEEKTNKDKNKEMKKETIKIEKIENKTKKKEKEKVNKNKENEEKEEEKFYIIKLDKADYYHEESNDDNKNDNIKNNNDNDNSNNYSDDNNSDNEKHSKIEKKIKKKTSILKKKNENYENTKDNKEDYYMNQTSKIKLKESLNSDNDNDNDIKYKHTKKAKKSKFKCKYHVNKSTDENNHSIKIGKNKTTKNDSDLEKQDKYETKSHRVSSNKKENNENNGFKPLNPLKYFKHSFQKKQEDKFDFEFEELNDDCFKDKDNFENKKVKVRNNKTEELSNDTQISKKNDKKERMGIIEELLKYKNVNKDKDTETEESSHHINKDNDKKKSKDLSSIRTKYKINKNRSKLE